MAPRSTERPTLTREGIVEAAITLIDHQGLGALSMRRLGSELGVEAMALYRYVNGREDLLEAVVDDLTSRVRLSDDLHLGPHGSWQAYLQKLAHQIRDLTFTHPQVFPLIATRPPAAPWLRPPLRSLRVVEDFLQVLTGEGFSDDDAVAAYRTFTSFLIGQLLLAAAQRGAPMPASGEIDEGDASAPRSTEAIAEYPAIERLRGRLAEDHSDAEFERALEDLLNRIDARVSR
ncbi:TetR/AcrR family transcriptional regulator [Georgenia ruanii]|uniref:TetR family transcriptional regulator n=1 Tax=Georgenia ruanii TaxID=348442 RepID=A0A7J9UZ34_9MICO|nr:TetR/AcrR family transcriptional regulator C-terminal domain-containing protein [Georgenia ruanii]MPV89593.1 TetR family transcriptional regulator [Georgenia ruanii]